MRSPQKRARLAGLIVGAASLLGVLLVAFVNLRREAPGPVSAVHGAIEELAGGTNCAACHGGWFGDMQQSSLEQANVEVVSEISDLIAAQRAYEMNAKVISAADQMLQSTANLFR